MVRPVFEIPESFILEKSKQRINFNSVTNVFFWEARGNFVISKQPSKNSPHRSCFKRCCNEYLLKVAKNWAARSFCGNEILENGISL